MVEVWLPYGRTEVSVRVPDENLVAIVQPKEKPPAREPIAEIKRALENPIASKKLHEIAGSGEKAVIVVDDHTQPTPSHLLVPPILNELNSAGVRDQDITIIVSCGAHRMATQEEIQNLLGQDVTNRVKVINHDCNARDLFYIGETSFKTKAYINRFYAEADLKILTGGISLHYYAGYSGGRKSIAPGLLDFKSIQQIHSFILNPKAKTGVLEENPVHKNLNEIAHLAKPDFTLNVVLNGRRQVIQAFAGDLDQAFIEGVKLVDEIYMVPVEKSSDIVIVSANGYPMDQSLCQSYRAIHNVLNIVERRGVIILVAECPLGHGNAIFYEWMSKFKKLKDVKREVKKKFVLGGHKAYYLIKALDWTKIILVSIMPDYYATGVFRLRTEKTVNSALSSAIRMIGKKSRVLVVPFGSTTLPVIKK